MMKKLLVALTSLLTILVLTACQTSTKPTEDSADMVSVTLSVVLEKDTLSKEDSFKEGTTVLDALKANHKVEMDAGMVTSIDGVSQDASKNTYWMYTINGELAPKGVEEMTLSQGDKIEFYLEKFE